MDEIPNNFSSKFFLINDFLQAKISDSYFYIFHEGNVYTYCIWGDCIKVFFVSVNITLEIMKLSAHYLNISLN